MRIIKLEEPKLLHQYRNGNYMVSLYEDGTKIRENDLDFFESEFPENCDIKITNKCDLNCKFCHENSTKDGKHGNLDYPFLKSLRKGTELAIGGGNIFEHPEIDSFLSRLKEQGIISNITLNQYHIKNNIDLVNSWIDDKKVYGVGISYNGNIAQLMEIIGRIHKKDNIVIHVINGIHNLDELCKLNLKVLILGYKNLRRGEDFLSKNNANIMKLQLYTKSKLPDYLHDKNFKVLSFDNLALTQLSVKDDVDSDYWEDHYMGDDGTMTMFIDLVDGTFASSSTSSKRFSLDGYTDIADIFKTIKTI